MASGAHGKLLLQRRIGGPRGQDMGGARQQQRAYRG
jgi:hypothetical protein